MDRIRLLAQHATREEEVLPGPRLVDWVAKKVRRVLRDHERSVAVPMNPVAKAGYRRVRAEQVARGTLPQRNDESRRDQVDLPVQIRAARLCLDRFRRPIVR